MRSELRRFAPYLLLLGMLLQVPPLRAEEPAGATPTATRVEAPASAALKRAVDAALETCAPDIKTYCATVTPGEGRILACVIAHKDKVSEACRTALGTLELPDMTLRLNSTTSYPTLEERQLGEPNRDAEGKAVVWDRALPFLAQNVIDLGFDLPKPYGIAVIPAWIKQDLVLKDLAISINNGPMTKIDFVDFGSPQVENQALQVKLDAWLFPFMNVFTTFGWFNGKAAIPLKIEGTDLFPGLCAITPASPLCVRTYSAIARPEYEGRNIALGVNLAMGWDRFFVTLPITYAWTDVNILDTTVTAFNISPRFGVTGDLGKWGVIAPFLGINYLSAEVDLAGRVTFDTPGGPSGDSTTVDFQINQSNKDKINYLLGFNWDFSKTWSVMAEAGIGGSRQSFISALTFRF